MPSGAAVICYRGKRGNVWRVKYIDANGTQVKETLGPASEGWTKRKADAELRARLVAVEKNGMRKPSGETFETFAEEWLATYPDAKGLKRSTRQGYEQIVHGHLVPTFGSLKLGEITVQRIERYLATKRNKGLSPATLNRTLNVLSLIIRAALRRGLVQTNPVSLVDRPREPRRRWRILSPPEMLAVEQALAELIAETDDEDERSDREITRVMFLTFMGTGIRHGEALGLHWRSVLLEDVDGPIIRIEETWVRHAADTPKSAAGHRTIALGSRITAELSRHRQRSSFKADDERVFGNPRTGHPFDANRYATILRLALARAAIEGDIRPAHDLRHSSITNAAAAGISPEALMSRAGHSSYATTRRYIDLAGERFRGEADRLEERLWGETGTKKRYQKRSKTPTATTK